MSHIFISYSHKDKDYVHKLQDALQNEGFDVWIDDRINYRSAWPKVIQKHLDECGAFIVVMTENAYDSEWVQNEVTRARRKKKPFYALLLRGDTWLSFEAIQYEDVSGERLPKKKFYEDLASVIPRAAAERALQEKLEREIAKRERAERRAARLATLKERLSKSFATIKSTLPKAIPFLRIAGFIGIAIVLFWVGSWGIPILASLVPTPKDTPRQSPVVPITATNSRMPPTRTLVPSAIPSLTSTSDVIPNVGFNKIVFVSDMDCSAPDSCRNIYIMNADGTDRKSLTAEAQTAYNWNPAISPDGKRVAFSASASATDDVYAVSLTDLKISLLATGFGYPNGATNLSWSPDGNLLIYDAYINDDIRSVIELFNTKTNKTTQLTLDNQDDTSPAFSFDGTKVAFISDLSSAQRLYVMDIDGTNRTLLFGDLPCLNPDFSPVGLVIALQCWKNSNWNLFIFDMMTKKLTQLTNSPADEDQPSWSPDGKRIAFSSNMDDPDYATCSPAIGRDHCNNEIYVIDSDGSNLTRLTLDDADDNSPDWGP
jgi:hypothetical protein